MVHFSAVKFTKGKLWENTPKFQEVWKKNQKQSFNNTMTTACVTWPLHESDPHHHSVTKFEFMENCEEIV